MSKSPELDDLREAAGLVSIARNTLAISTEKRDEAILAAHANTGIPMTDIYTAADLSPAGVQKILAKAQVTPRPKYRPTKAARVTGSAS